MKKWLQKARVKKDVKSKEAAKKWLWWWFNGKSFNNNNSGEFEFVGPQDPPNLPKIVVIKIFAIELLSQQFLLDFTLLLTLDFWGPILFSQLV